MIKNHEEMKLNNQLRLLRTIKDRGPVTRGELQRITALGWGTVTASVGDFIARGIVRETESVATGVGRRPIRLDMNTDRNYVIGLRIGRSTTRSLLMDVRGNVLGELSRSVQSSDRDGIIRDLFAVVDDLMKDKGVSRSDLAGIGIATPGSVDYTAGTIRFIPNYPSLNNTPIKRRFERRYELPCFLDHTSNCFARAEHLFGHGRGVDNFLVVLIGSGISAGIVIGGHVYQGHDSASGEFGHITVDRQGEVCDCGNRGCLELYASGRSIGRLGQEAAQQGDTSILTHAGHKIKNVTAREVYLAALEGDTRALEVYRQVGESLGIGISSLINILNPAVVIIGGAVVRAAEFFLPTVRAVVEERAWAASEKRIEVSSLENGVCIGAGANVLHMVYEQGLLLS